MKLKVPSLQHMARNWRPTAEKTAKVLIALAQNSPTFNYNPLFGAVHDLMVLGVPYDQVCCGIEVGTSRPSVRKNFLEVLPLIRDHFEDAQPDFVQQVGRRYYPVGRGLMVPFEPPMLFGTGGQLHFPWFSFWRQNPLKDARLALFVTVVDQILKQDPDLEDARFEVLDFSCDPRTKERRLQVIDARDIPKLSEADTRDMLEVFAQGYALAAEHLSGLGPKPDKRKQPDPPNPDQRSFWDE